jgi:hypothetical protein
MWLKIALLGLCFGTLNLIHLAAAAEPSVVRGPSMKVSAAQLRFEVPDIGLPAPDRAAGRTTRLLSLASTLPEYDCRLSQGCLNTVLPPSVEFDTPFRDILLDVSVHGQVHAKGKFWISLAPDGDHACFDLRFAGTMRMIGTGNTHGVKVDSAFTTEFQGSKRIRCDGSGLHYLPSRCRARSSMTIQSIRNVRPRMLSRIYERVAHRRARATFATAEQECSQHVEHGIRVFMDQYVAAVAENANTAFRDHVRGLSVDQKFALGQVRFRTEKDRLVILRGPENWSPFVEYDLSGTSLVIALPRSRLGQNPGILLLFLGNEGGADFLRLFEGGRLRPSVDLGSQSIFLLFEI